MIHLIHGPDLASSRTHLNKIREGKETLVIDARSEENWWEKLSQFSFFTPEIVIVDWIKEKQIKLLPKKIDQTVVFWSEETIKKTDWANQVSFFPLKSVNVFKLVDAFGLRKISQSQIYLQKTLAEKTSPELIISLLIRQLKLISLSQAGNSEEIGKSAFLKSKIADQAKLWSEKGLVRAFRALLEADLAIKNGIEPEIALSLAFSKVNPNV